MSINSGQWAAKFQITVPTSVELMDALPFQTSFPATDFAIVTGVKADDPRHNFGGEKLLPCPCWTREVGSQTHINTLHLASIKVTRTHGGIQKYSGYADGVLPRFINPELGGFGVTKVDNESFLTYRGKVVTYPRNYHSELATSAVENFIKAGDLMYDNDLSITTDGQPHGESEDRDKPFLPQTNRCLKSPEGNIYTLVTNPIYAPFTDFFQYGHPYERNYERGRAYCFTNEPVRATLCDDGSIQCQEAIVAAQFEPDAAFLAKDIREDTVVNTDDFAIGRFLNEILIKDLMRSVEKELEYDKVNETARKTFKIGNKVHLKYEGKDGVFRGFDGDGHARITVGSQTKTYRVGDISI